MKKEKINTWIKGFIWGAIIANFMFGGIAYARTYFAYLIDSSGNFFGTSGNPINVTHI